MPAWILVSLTIGTYQQRNKTSTLKKQILTNIPGLGNRRLRKSTDTSHGSLGRWERSAIDRWRDTQVRSVWVRATGARVPSWTEWREAPTSRGISLEPSNQWVQRLSHRVYKNARELRFYTPCVFFNGTLASIFLFIIQAARLVS